MDVLLEFQPGRGFTFESSANFTNDVAKMDIRKMDCMDCHNRPSHRYLSPEKAVNQAMALKKIDPKADADAGVP